MKVTSATFRAMNYEKSPSLLGMGSVVLEEQLVIKDLRILTGKYGTFVQFPSRKDNNSGKYYDTVYPITKELRDDITKAILDEMDTKPANTEEDIF